MSLNFLNDNCIIKITKMLFKFYTLNGNRQNYNTTVMGRVLNIFRQSKSNFWMVERSRKVLKREELIFVMKTIPKH